LLLRCIQEGGFFRLGAYVVYEGLKDSYKPWPSFLVDTGSLDTYLTTLRSTIVNGISIPLKGLPSFDTEVERTGFIEQYPTDEGKIEWEGQPFERRQAKSAKLTFLSETGMPAAEITLPQIYLAPLPNNVLGLDVIKPLGAFHLLSTEAYFELDESLLLKNPRFKY
jgi:hypothetical protein